MGRREVNSSFKWFLPVFATWRGRGEGIRAVWTYPTGFWRFRRFLQVWGSSTAACRAILQVSQGFTGIFRLGTHQQRQWLEERETGDKGKHIILAQDLCHRFLKVLVIGGEKGYLFYLLIGQVSGDYKQFFPRWLQVVKFFSLYRSGIRRLQAFSFYPYRSSTRRLQVQAFPFLPPFRSGVRRLVGQKLQFHSKDLTLGFLKVHRLLTGLGATPHFRDLIFRFPPKQTGSGPTMQVPEGVVGIHRSRTFTLVLRPRVHSRFFKVSQASKVQDLRCSFKTYLQVLKVSQASLEGPHCKFGSRQYQI